MHRAVLLGLLDRYLAANPAEAEVVGRIGALVREHTDCLRRTCRPGHVTASAWIVSADHSRFLLTHHRKLGCWLQLGGHADGDADVAAVALREAREESGMEHFDLFGPGPIDVDVHDIPARPGESAHEHHDFRFLLVAAPDQELVVSDESHELAWFPSARLEQVVAEEGMLRLARKAMLRLDGA